ncbi:unnamed protein product [marine sediment metagenome]|uniref:Uncharacterized protein n=1 Tax=marine sediment metagenome TaxID=412755 RepID=X1RFS6_9ZZZZ
MRWWEPERENERNNQKAKLVVVVSPAGIACWETGIITKEQ